MSKMRHFYKEFDKYAIFLLIGWLVNSVGFFVIGNMYGDGTIIWSALDEAIPFCLPFVIPYVIWFPYILVSFVCFWHFHKKSSEDHAQFIRLLLITMFGLLFCLSFYIIFPTTIVKSSRPDMSNGKGLLAYLMNYVYNGNVRNNALPSEHCYISMVLALGFVKAPALKKSKHRYWIYPASIILSVLICASTFYTKQHSVWDCVAALGLFLVLYVLIYCLPRIPTKQTNE
ncbi:MAG: phosphatase PAP2 family protein [Eubacteriales bacterium]|nr:phosphatase PAP2 family protein [Eubacteriales bacterium]